MSFMILSDTTFSYEFSGSKVLFKVFKVLLKHHFYFLEEIHFQNVHVELVQRGIAL